MKKLEKLTLKKLEQNMYVMNEKEQAKFVAGSGETLAMAKSFLGTTEQAGSGSNPTIVQFFTGTGVSCGDDSTIGWCGAFTNYCVTQNGGTSPSGATTASNWAGWGNGTTMPAPGDIAVAKDGSHVGIVESINADGTFTIISGNYSNQVKESTVTGSTYSFRHSNY